MTWTVENLEGNGGRAIPNQFVLTDGQTTVFQSYRSPVVKTWLSNDGRKIVFGKHWDYSRTTMKYVHLFLKDYCGKDWNADMIRHKIANGEVGYDESMQPVDR